MNYIDCDFKDSTSYNTVMNATIQQLKCRMGYVKNAINYHTENNNQGQVKFFTDELSLIYKRLGKCILNELKFSDWRRSKGYSSYYDAFSEINDETYTEEDGERFEKRWGKIISNFIHYCNQNNLEPVWDENLGWGD